LKNDRKTPYIIPLLSASAGFALGAIALTLFSNTDAPQPTTVVQDCPEPTLIQAKQPSPHIVIASRLMAAVDKSLPPVWFEQELTANGVRRHFFFFKKEEPYSLVDVGAQVGLVSFRLGEDERWVPEVVNPNLFTNGTRGEVTPQTSFQFERVSADHLLMIVRNRIDNFEGADHFLDLFMVADGTFSPAGRIFVGAHNKEMKCDGPTAKFEAFNRACMDFSGTLSIVTVPGQPVANLEVAYEGLKGDKYSTLEKATYRFTRGQYVQDVAEAAVRP